MTDWRRALADMRREVTERVRVAREVVEARLGEQPPHIITPYHGYGTRERWRVMARALRAAPLAPARSEDSAWRNLANMYRRLESDPLPAAEVRVRAGGEERVVVADDEGFIESWLTPRTSTDADWQEAELELLAPLRDGNAAPRVRSRVRVPGLRVSFLVVSDVDDTVLQSRISSTLQAARTVLLSNAHTRLPFPGVAAFYRALERGTTGDEANPIFYLSSSPWNLFDVIAEFMELRRLPAGPILLRDWDMSLDVLGRERLQAFKRRHLRELVSFYPTLPLILVGDTSQHDPEIYAELVREHPERVLAVYIRDVSRHPERSAALRTLATELDRAHVPLVVSEDTLGAARHAVDRGWISSAVLREIEEEVEG